VAKKTRFDSNLTLVKGDYRKVYFTLPLSVITGFRQEAKRLGVSLDDYIVSLLDAAEAKRKRRVTRTTKTKPTKKR
jgi:hypothetical protein